MSINLVQQSAAAVVGTNVTSITITVPANTTVGNAIIVNETNALSSNATLSFGTGMGINSTAWTQASNKIATGSTDNDFAFTWFGLNSSGGSASVVVTTSVTSLMTGAAAEFSGVVQSGALDASGTNVGSSSGPTTPSEGANNEVYIACEVDEGGNPLSGGPTNGFTVLRDNNTNQGFHTAYKKITGADNTGWTLSSASPWATVTGTYKPAAVQPPRLSLIGVGV